MNLIKEAFLIVWHTFWGFLSGIWPTLDAVFDINFKIVIAIIVVILTAIGVPAIVIKIVKRL